VQDRAANDDRKRVIAVSRREKPDSASTAFTQVSRLEIERTPALPGARPRLRRWRPRQRDLAQPDAVELVFSELTGQSSEFQAFKQVKAAFWGANAVAGRGPESIDEGTMGERYRTPFPLSAADLADVDAHNGRDDAIGYLSRADTACLATP
jgi:hypothetical protein